MVQHTIVHFEIPADDPEALAGFYRELFGWKIETAEGFEDYWSIQTAPEGEGVGGGLMKRQHPGQQPVNYIWVESVDEYVAKAQDLGAEVLMEKTPVAEMGWFAWLQDPQGNFFAVWESTEE